MKQANKNWFISLLDRLCGLVVEFLATYPEVRVRFPALPDFLRSSGSGTVSTRLVGTIEELLESKSSGSGLNSLN
jgi:hypothetical protein